MTGMIEEFFWCEIFDFWNFFFFFFWGGGGEGMKIWQVFFGWLDLSRVFGGIFKTI